MPRSWREKFKMKKIIVVDDDQCLLESITDVLSSEGYDVFTFTNGDNLYEQVLYMQPDLVVLDVRLPGVGGDVLATQLKASGETCRVPIILISASEDLRAIFHQVGVEGHLAKPFDLETFVNLIKGQIAQDSWGQ